MTKYESEVMEQVMKISIDYAKEVSENKALKAENEWLKSIIEKYIAKDCSFEIPRNP